MGMLHYALEHVQTKMVTTNVINVVVFIPFSLKMGDFKVQICFAEKCSPLEAKWFHSLQGQHQYHPHTI